MKKEIQQQKHKLSNWDETMIESIEVLCDDKIRFTEFQDTKEHLNDIKNWLKDLKERIKSE